MLSAVAARKARLAQTQAPPPAEAQAPAAAPASPKPEPKISAPAKPASTSQKPPSKRKPSASSGNPPKKKRTQQSKAAFGQQARYFAQEDAFKTQDDVIVVDDSDSETSVATSSAASDDENGLRSVRTPAAKVGGKRAWSPSAPLADSSDDDEDDGDEPIVLDSPVKPAKEYSPDSSQVLSTFQPVREQNVFHLPTTSGSSRAGVVLLLSSSDTVALLGTYTLTVLRGSIALSGITLEASPATHPVFAPRSSPIPIIQCLPRHPPSNSPSPLDLPAHIADAASDAEAVILVQELHTGIEGLGRICRTFDGFFAPSRWQRNQLRFDLGLENVYFLSNQTPDVFPLVVPPTWMAATTTVSPHNDDNSATERYIYLVKGPKNSGKSTFARLLLNKLLSRFRRVAYLECDLGQSEFTPGGMVSLNVVEQPLFGPPFTHPSVPFAAHFVGATSPRTSPSHYLESIQALLQQYEIDVRNATLDEDSADSEDDRISSSIPLVVNTMGWTKGLGADLARRIEEILEPSDIFVCAGMSFDDEFGYGGHEPAPPSVHVPHSGGPRIHSIESVSQDTSASHYTAADHRNLSILSYFHATFPQAALPSPYASPTPSYWNTGLPLCAQPPYEVDFQVAFDKLILTGAGSEDVVQSEVHRALNCAVVALVTCEPGTLDLNLFPDADADTCSNAASPFKYEQGAPPPPPSTSRCLGLGLVRAVSPPSASKVSIQLLTPVPQQLLAEARVLVMGELQLPVWGMLDYRTLDTGGDIAGYERGRVPYLRWGKGEGAGGERRRVRRNLMRKGQM
ncbi:hypothetical protein C8Q77DRAFT_1047087 [Trametes polyzona]|nr:hypothetical protein C8Q77DRAFT_1047087 [Trametes polyzona]